MDRRHFLKVSGAATLGALSLSTNVENLSAAPQDVAGSSGKVKIKITAVEPMLVRGRSTWVFVRIKTDQEVEGIGEAFAGYEWSKPIQASINKLGPQLVVHAGPPAGGSARSVAQARRRSTPSTARRRRSSHGPCTSHTRASSSSSVVRKR